MPNKNRTIRNLTIFSVLVIGISIFAGVIEPYTLPPGSKAGASGLGQLLWIVAPLTVALLLRVFGGDGWDDFGWRPNFKGNGFWWLASIFILPILIAIIILIGKLLGGLVLNETLFPDFATALVTGFVAALIKNIFEEFAWRGYLAPKVYSLNLNIWLSHAIVGIIWGAWHLPFIYVFWTYLTPNMIWYFVPLLLAGTISQSVVYGEIRLATGSVLPAWIMHTLGNSIGNALLFSEFLKIQSGLELWFSPGAESVVSILMMLGIGYWLHQRREHTAPV